MTREYESVILPLNRGTTRVGAGAAPETDGETDMTTYLLCVDGTDVALGADDLDEARAEALTRLPESYDVEGETYWVTGDLVEVEGGDRTTVERLRVAIDPEEPTCSASLSDDVRAALQDDDSPEGHRWRAPHDLVGGCKENPGVRGHGGGVVITHVCTLCGAKRITDTWAQDTTDGTQGLTSVRYVEDAEDVTRSLRVTAPDDDDSDGTVGELIAAHGGDMRDYEGDAWLVDVSRGARAALEMALGDVGADVEVRS